MSIVYSLKNTNTLRNIVTIELDFNIQNMIILNIVCQEILKLCIFA